MTFLPLSLGQLLYALTCQRGDVRKLRPDHLLENKVLDGALLISAGTALLPFFVPPLRCRRRRCWRGAASRSNSKSWRGNHEKLHDNIRSGDRGASGQAVRSDQRLS